MKKTRSFIYILQWRILLYGIVVLLVKQHCVLTERPTHSAYYCRNQRQYGRLQKKRKVKNLASLRAFSVRLLTTYVSIITPGFCTLPIDNASLKNWTDGYLAFKKKKKNKNRIKTSEKRRMTRFEPATFGATNQRSTFKLQSPNKGFNWKKEAKWENSKIKEKVK